MKTPLVAAALSLALALAGCGGSLSNEPDERGQDATSKATEKASAAPEPVEFSDLRGMRAAYQDLVGTECAELDPPSDEADVDFVTCDASSGDTSADVLIHEKDDPYPVQDLTNLQIGLSSGSVSRVAAYEADWVWSVVTADPERLDLVRAAFPNAAEETFQGE